MPKQKIKKRADGRVQIQRNYKGYGKKWFYGKTLAECEKKRKLFEATMLQPANMVNPVVKFGEYKEVWFAAVKNTISDVTYQTYKSVDRSHLSHFDDVPIGNLTGTEIMAYIQRKLDGGLSTRTVQGVFILMKAILQSAVVDNVILRNPLLGFKRPKYVRVHPFVALTEKQVKKLFSVITNEKHRVMVELAVVSGLRRSELLGLRWEDLSFDENTLTINQTVLKVGKIVTIKPSTKTKSSRRTIYIDKSTMAKIKSLKAACLKQKLLSGVEYVDNGLVFPGLNGRPMYPDVFTKMVKGYGEKAGMPEGFTLHALRHTHATLLLRAGVHFKVVQSRLGHSTSKQTLDTYSHVTPDLDYGAAQTLQSIVKG